MRRRKSRLMRQEQVELNITAFMNLMVVLVPFLLVMAVFSRITILELNFPSGEQAQQDQQQKQAQDLEVMVYKNVIVVGTRQGGEIQRFKNTKDGYDLVGVSKLLQKIKTRLPDKTEITILLDAQVKYDSLVQVMDTVRMTKVMKDGQVIKAELFPQISIGDAPKLKSAAVRGKGAAG